MIWGRSAEDHIAPGQKVPLWGYVVASPCRGDRMSHQPNPKRGSFPADGQENGAILRELLCGAETKSFLIREEFNRPLWESALQHAKGQVSFWKPFLLLPAGKIF